MTSLGAPKSASSGHDLGLAKVPALIVISDHDKVVSPSKNCDVTGDILSPKGLRHLGLKKDRTMEQRISLITLGVADMERSLAFYDALGWARVETHDGVVAYDLIGQTLGLYPLEKLAEDIGVSVNELGAGRASLGYNCREKQQVAEVLKLAKGAGARILKPATDVFWGGHHGYFADPDGHIWEIAHNPFSPLRADGAFRWNGYG